MQYCPNCSAFQYDQNAERCPKCGFDLTTANQNVTTIPEEDLPKKKVEPGFDPKKPCETCGSPTRPVNGEIEVPVEGERISIRGLKLMGGDITKRVVTQITYDISGYECREGHKFFSRAESKVRPLCPVCYHPMIKYGSSLLSCTRCNRHYPVNDWPDPDPMEVLDQEGWQRI